MLSTRCNNNNSCSPHDWAVTRTHTRLDSDIASTLFIMSFHGGLSLSLSLIRTRIILIHRSVVVTVTVNLYTDILILILVCLVVTTMRDSSRTETIIRLHLTYERIQMHGLSLFEQRRLFVPCVRLSY